MRTDPEGRGGAPGATLVVLAALLAAVAALQWSGYRGVDFWWPDSPRHALGGALVHDYFSQAPLSNPLAFAKTYYIRYPAFSLGLYPPGFYVIEGGVFALTGVSSQSALAVVGLFYFIAAAALYFLARVWLGRLASFSTALLFIALPEISRWGREVMLDVPMCAFLLLGVCLFVRLLDRPNRGAVYWASLPLIAAIYIKYNAAFLAPLMAGILIWRRGREELLTRRFWVWGGLSLLLLAPAAALMWRLGRFNVTQAVEVGPGQGAQLELLSFANWAYYLRHLPKQIGWETTILAAVALAALVAWPSLWRRFPRVEVVWGWFLFGYVVFSLIALKEPRHSLALLAPALLAAVLLLRMALPARVFSAAIFGWAVVRFALALMQPLPAVDGYSRAADQVAQVARPNGVVMFFGSGRGCGNVAFRFRSRYDGLGLILYRADKLLYKMRSNMSTIEPMPLEADGLGDRITGFGVEYVVFESTPFLDKLDNTQTLLNTLRSPQFEQVAAFPITGSGAYKRNGIEIFRNLHPLPVKRAPIRYDIPIADFSIGEVNGDGH